MKRLLWFLVLVCQLVFAPLLLCAENQIPPRPTSSIYIQDQAGVLSQSTRDTISAYSAALDRKSRIEVGYGLEGALPDGLTGRIQDEDMLPYFRQEDYDKGILNAYSTLLQTVLKEYNLSPQDLQVENKLLPQEAPNTESISPLTAGLWIMGILVLFVLDHLFLKGVLLRFLIYLLGLLVSKNGGRGGGGSGGGGGSSRSW